MGIKANEVQINGVVYVPKGNVPAEKVDGMPYVICRTYSAGVFAGHLKSRKGKEADIVNARRIWYWDGAASLSQLATEGTNKPANCKFTVSVPLTTVTEAIEIITCTDVAKSSIEGVTEWKK